MDLTKALRPSKHFRNTWMRKWNWDMHDLRTAIEEAYETKKVGKKKYEVYTRYKGKKGKGKSRKLILVDCPEEIFIITGAEGK